MHTQKHLVDGVMCPVTAILLSLALVVIVSLKAFFLARISKRKKE